MDIEEKMMPIDEWNKQFKCKYMQQPISFLTEENLDRLQQHCEKTIQYGNGRILEEHQVTLELIIRYRELKQELEKEKEKNKTQPDCVEPVERTEEMVNMRWVNHRFISKDKLKEILGIEEETDSEKILALLQTLVDENARLEDIEDKKVQIEYNNVFNKGVKSVEDKIKAKIEELEIEQESNREDLKIAIDNLLVQNIDKIANKISINMSIRGILQSLLEKE